MIKVSAIGNIGSDPELKFTTSGTPVLNFSLASNAKKDGNETTTWLRVALFGKRAEALAKLLNKGEKIAIFGSLEERKYQGQNGPGTSLDVTCDDVELLGNRRDGDADQRQERREPQTSNAQANDRNAKANANNQRRSPW